MHRPASESVKRYGVQIHKLVPQGYPNQGSDLSLYWWAQGPSAEPAAHS